MANQVAGSQTKLAADVAQLQTDIESLNNKYESIKNMMANICANNAGFHNSIFRGRDLGNAVTTEQWASIQAGTFDDMFIGDYWTIDGVNWLIAAFDYWYNFGQSGYRCFTHHVNIVPETPLLGGKMHNSATTETGYAGSDFYTGANDNTAKETLLTIINNAFGSEHILEYCEQLSTAVTNGYETSTAWYNDCKINLMTERMVYGCEIMHNAVHGTNIPAPCGTAAGQLPLFRLDRKYISFTADASELPSHYWLRDVVSAERYAICNGRGNPAHTTADKNNEFRPIFAIRAA